MAQELSLGQVVRSKAGRDKDRYFVVWEILNDSCVYLVDGDLRKVENPKRKNIKHLQRTNRVLDPVAVRLKTGDKVTNAEICRLIADLKEMGDKNC